MEIITEIEQENLKNYFFNENKKFLIRYNNIFQIHYNINSGFSTSLIYRNSEKLPLTRKGRYFIEDANFVNRLLKRNFVID